MPYIMVRDNRYIGEHSCDNHHSGDQTMIRECCVADAIKWKENTLRVAITDQHPSYALFCAAYESLTDAERWLVGNIRPFYDHGPSGFVKCDQQKEFAL